MSLNKCSYQILKTIIFFFPFASLLDENDEEQTLSPIEMESDISTSNSPNANVTKGEESMDVCNSDDDNVDKE